MRFVPTIIHGVIDYLVGIALIAAPWVLGFATNGPEQWIPIALGIIIVLYSLVTDYELGIARVLSMRLHLLLDLASGLFLAASPWLFDFKESVCLPHVIVGIVSVVLSLVTVMQPKGTGDPDIV